MQDRYAGDIGDYVERGMAGDVPDAEEGEDKV